MVPHQAECSEINDEEKNLPIYFQSHDFGEPHSTSDLLQYRILRICVDAKSCVQVLQLQPHKRAFVETV